MAFSARSIALARSRDKSWTWFLSFSHSRVLALRRLASRLTTSTSDRSVDVFSVATKSSTGGSGRSVSADEDVSGGFFAYGLDVGVLCDIVFIVGGNVPVHLAECNRVDRPNLVILFISETAYRGKNFRFFRSTWSPTRVIRRAESRRTPLIVSKSCTAEVYTFSNFVSC